MLLVIINDGQTATERSYIYVTATTEYDAHHRGREKLHTHIV